MHSQGDQGPLEQPLLPFYRKKGEEVAAQLAQASWVASSRSNPASQILWKAQFQNFKIAICIPHFR